VLSILVPLDLACILSTGMNTLHCMMKSLTFVFCYYLLSNTSFSSKFAKLNFSAIPFGVNQASEDDGMEPERCGVGKSSDLECRRSTKSELAFGNQDSEDDGSEPDRCGVGKS